MFRVTLVSMPWPFFNRPSLQLGALKSYLKADGDGLDVSAYPAYLEVAAEIGFPLYQEISQRSWMAEAAYALLLSPEKEGSIAAFLERQKGSRQWPRGIPLDVSFLRDKLVQHQEDSFLGRDWDACDLAGFSICLNQLTPSLHAIRTLKTRYPRLAIVAGGSSCSGEMGRALLSHVPEIDFVVSGEGEKPLLSVTQFLQGKTALPGPGVYYRDGAVAVAGCGSDQVQDLDALPVPDYDDYFACLGKVAPDAPFLPTLPVEFSRGCWWGKCRFCNLNIQWHGYRKKTTARMLTEIAGLSDRYASIDLAFADNALPPKAAEELFRGMAGMGRDFNVFAELRAEEHARALSVMRRAGLRKVQVGIEALSTPLLKRMGKGTTAIQNIEIMRHCEEVDIIESGNLIAMFPGSTPEEVQETLDNLDFVWPFHPLTIVPFWLGYGSPVHCSAKDYGLKRVRNHPFYELLLPDGLHSGLALMQQDYRGDQAAQRALWKPVMKKVEAWSRDYFRLRSRFPSKPLLSCRDAGSLLIIRQTRPDGSIRLHRLRGTSRAVYLFCTSARTLSAVQAEFPRQSLDSLRTFLDELAGKRIMFKENDRYLSLAVREEGPRPLRAGEDPR